MNLRENVKLRVFLQISRPSPPPIRTMRLRLAIQRNRLPLVKTLFAIDAASDPPPTISKLLEQVNELVPLEAETWGLEDYVVTIGAYECLHYSKVVDVIKEDDEICIRPISTPETRTRTLSGRYQINASGQHLTDGIPFGRPLIRAPTRPAVHIPPRKRRKLALELDSFQFDEESDEEPKLLENGVAAADDEDENSEEEDEDFIPGEEDDDMEGSDEEMEDKEEGRMTDAREDSGSLHLGSKRKRSVSFSKVVDVEKDSHSILTGSSSSEDEDSEESEDDSDSESDVSSSADETSEDEDEEPNSRTTKPADDSDDSDTTSEDTSEDDDDDSASSAEKQLQADSQRKLQIQAATDTTQPPPIDKKPVPPGEGKRETQKRNIRRRQKKRLENLIKTGKLPPNATINDLEVYLPEAATDQCSSTVHDHATGMEELEVQRQRLLEQLQYGGIEIANVVSKRGKDLNMASTESPLGLDRSSTNHVTSSSTLKDQSPTEYVGDEDEVTLGSAEPRRPRLNLAGSNRLIFGSLGVRAPKSKDDGETVRQKLAARGELHRADASVSTKPTADTLEDANVTKDPHTDVLSDGWKSKIILKAVECVDEDVELSQPPYPFVQCWDEQYAWNRPQSNRKKRNKKRKNQTMYTQEEEDEEYTEEWTEDMYDDETSAKPDSMARKHLNQEHHEPALVENAGFPSMPTDVQAFPALAAQYCNPDTYIVFKELHVDASTKWQPEISGWQLARVDENTGGDGLKLTLAPEHRVTEQARYDDAGRRVREGFEMPESDDDDEEGAERIDNGVREVALESLMEVRLLEDPDANRGAESEPEVYGDMNTPPTDTKSLAAAQKPGDTDLDADDACNAIGREDQASAVELAT